MTEPVRHVVLIADRHRQFGPGRDDPRLRRAAGPPRPGGAYPLLRLEVPSRRGLDVEEMPGLGRPRWRLVGIRSLRRPGAARRVPASLHALQAQHGTRGPGDRRALASPLHPGRRGVPPPGLAAPPEPALVPGLVATSRELARRLDARLRRSSRTRPRGPSWPGGRGVGHVALGHGPDPGLRHRGRGAARPRARASRRSSTPPAGCSTRGSTPSSCWWARARKRATFAAAPIGSGSPSA